MKKFLSIILLTGLVIAAGCRKNDNPKLPEGIESVPFPQLTADATSDVLIQEVSDFKGKFTLDVYFKDQPKPKKMDLVVAMNGDYSVTKTLQADITSFPVTVDVTGPQLAALFGLQPEDVALGDYFEIRANMTLTNGKVLNGFIPSVYDADSNLISLEPYGSDITNFPNSNLTITYKKVCALNIDDFVGDFTLEDPDFYEDNLPVTIERVGTTDSLKLTGYAGDPASVLYMIVDERTQTINIPKQVYLPLLWGYHNAALEGTGSIDACNIAITLKTTNTVTEGSFGTFTSKIRK